MKLNLPYALEFAFQYDRHDPRLHSAEERYSSLIQNLNRRRGISASFTLQDSTACFIFRGNLPGLQDAFEVLCTEGFTPPTLCFDTFLGPMTLPVERPCDLLPFLYSAAFLSQPLDD